MKDRVAYLQSNSGAITLMLGNETYSIAVDHPSYFKIIENLREPDAEELRKLLDVATAVSEYTEGKIKIREGLFLYDGLELHNSLTERLMKLMVAGHPFDYMLKFLNNLMENPSGRAVKELYTFLENRSLPITADGCFLAYKRLRDDWTDVWTGTIDNRVGEKISMPRNRVDDNCNVGCSEGLHAGAIEYAKDYGRKDGKMVIVKIHPKDVVSVPLDSKCTKIRTCAYEVVDEYEIDMQEEVYQFSEGGGIESLISLFSGLSTHLYDEEEDCYDGE